VKSGLTTESTNQCNNKLDVCFLLRAGAKQTWKKDQNDGKRQLKKPKKKKVESKRQKKVI
jgi:hypothetical protein